MAGWWSSGGGGRGWGGAQGGGRWSGAMVGEGQLEKGEVEPI